MKRNIEYLLHFIPYSTSKTKIETWILSVLIKNRITYLLHFLSNQKARENHAIEIEVEKRNGIHIYKKVIDNFLAPFSGLELARVPKDAWHLRNFWTVMSGTRWFWQFYYIMLCCTLEFWGFTSDWHPLFQIPNSSPELYWYPIFSWFF